MQGIPHTSKILFWIMFRNEIDLSLAKPPNSSFNLIAKYRLKLKILISLRSRWLLERQRKWAAEKKMELNWCWIVNKIFLILVKLSGQFLTSEHSPLSFSSCCYFHNTNVLFVIHWKDSLPIFISLIWPWLVLMKNGHIWHHDSNLQIAFPKCLP